MDLKDSFSIRQMMDLTGLSEFTLRGWENRYAVFSPKRTDTGRRLYSKRDVERALLLRELLKRGHRIGKIAPLTNQKLQDIFDHDESPTVVTAANQPDPSVELALRLMSLQKWDELHKLIQNTTYKSVPNLIHNFLIPMISGLSALVAGDLVSIAQEHVVTAFLKEKIYSVLSQINTSKKSSNSKRIRFVLATPEGDYHELGLLMGHLLIRSFGIKSLYVGPNTPSKELSETALRFDATHILVASTVSKKLGAEQHLYTYIQYLGKNAGSNVKIVVAGNETLPAMNQEISSFERISNFMEFEQRLLKITKRAS